MTSMPSFLHERQSLFWRKSNRSLLAFFWIIGLVLGIIFGWFTNVSRISLMRRLSASSVSIVGLLCVTALPFLLSAFVFFISQPWMLMPICFVKAFLFSYVSLTVFQEWYSAGWLIWSLLLFSDCTTAPLLYLFWLRWISGEREISKTELFCVLSVVILISCVDFCIISPFGAHIIDYWKG